MKLCVTLNVCNSHVETRCTLPNLSSTFTACIQASMHGQNNNILFHIMLINKIGKSCLISIIVLSKLATFDALAFKLYHFEMKNILQLVMKVYKHYIEAISKKPEMYYLIRNMRYEARVRCTIHLTICYYNMALPKIPSFT